MTRAESVFRDYTYPFMKYGDKILLKTAHSLRVSELCKDIAGSLGLNGDEKELAAACGLLHDIGRFEQWEKYRTYNDLKSVDHGTLGAEVLTHEHLLFQFPESDRNTILRAVRYHNKYKVPDTLNERNRLYVNITRDADKIDVLRLYAEGVHNNPTENSILSDNIYQSLLAGKSIRKENVRRKDDEIAIRLAFIFDLNFKRSFEIIKEKDFLGRIIGIHMGKTSSAELKKQLEDLRIILNRYIEEKTD